MIQCVSLWPVMLSWLLAGAELLKFSVVSDWRATWYNLHKMWNRKTICRRCGNPGSILFSGEKWVRTSVGLAPMVAELLLVYLWNVSEFDSAWRGYITLLAVNPYASISTVRVWRMMLYSVLIMNMYWLTCVSGSLYVYTVFLYRWKRCIVLFVLTCRVCVCVCMHACTGCSRKNRHSLSTISLQPCVSKSRGFH